MTKRGTATLPLHDGSVPRWLFDRMVELGGAVAEVVIEEYGPEELPRRLADPYWFQALGCALGFDWHSSGVTTTTMAALKEALDPAEHGVVVVGGKGATSRETPDELAAAAPDLPGAGAADLRHHSRTSATVDDACVQDGYTLYHHTMVVAESGSWCVVQQGMGESTARRYHWLDEAVDSFVEEPQAAICAQRRRGSVLDLTAAASAEARAVSVDLVEDDPAHLKRYLRPSGQRTLADFAAGDAGGRDPPVPDLRMPARHELRDADLSERALENLRRAYEYGPDDYEELVGIEGVGPASLRALALIAELVYDAESSREDPAKYAYAHGGKDGTPQPVDRERYDRSIEFVRRHLQGADVDAETKQSALERLAELA